MIEKVSFFFKEGEDPIHATIQIEVARQHATNFSKAGIKGCSQHFPGKENDVPDALSWDDDQNNETLTSISCSCIPEQVPEHFEIVPLPNKIVSSMISLLQRLPVNMQLQGKNKRTKLGCGKKLRCDT